MKPSQYIQRGWCRGATALDFTGNPCLPLSSSARQWCLIGAIGAAYPEDFQVRIKVADAIELMLNTHQFAQWNDDPKRTQAEVVELLQSIGE